MGNIFNCCKDDDYDAEWYYSQESLPKDIDIEAGIDWSNTPQNSPLSDREIAELYRMEYLYQNRYRNK